MATIKFLTSPLLEYGDKMFSCSLFSAERTPEKKIEATTMAEVTAALDAFAAELKADGKAWVITTHVMKGSRAPNGFKPAEGRGELRRFVNEHLVTKKVA